MALGSQWVHMFFDLTNSMSMNMLVAPESMRALTDMGVLLSMVLRRRGMLVPLRGVADRTRRGILASWGVGCSGMTGSVFGSVVTGDGGVNISLVNPTVLVSKTKNLLVRQGVDFTVDLPKNPLGFFGLFPSLSSIHCRHCLGHQAFEVELSQFGRPNLLLLRFRTVS